MGRGGNTSAPADNWEGVGNWVDLIREPNDVLF